MLSTTPLISLKVQKYTLSQTPAMKTPVSSAVKQAMISMTLANELNTAHRPDLNNSLSMVTFSSAVFEVHSKVEMDEMGNTAIQTPALNADDASMSSLSLVIPTQSTPNVSFSPAKPAPLQPTPTFSLFRTSQVQPKPRTDRHASSPSLLTLSVNHQKSPAKPQCFVSSNQPCYAKAFKVETQSTGAIASEQFSNKVQKYTSACQVQKAMKYLYPLGISPTSRWTPPSDLPQHNLMTVSLAF
ncbi:hypothetical protein BLNAU_15117 [Blattamonas nauphoetae]|uniref:Uncharacterized protein n=1 Tax=Blattamonas nauphoetae TaxID=2049346 RepID=A0ABQ9XGJ3_9EUKA|nr:hypothetical protein BLNAU_15117 [Blattamonas nauphoetae]